MPSSNLSFRTVSRIGPALPNLLLGGLVGAIVALTVLPLGFIAGTGGLWPRPWGDVSTYLLAWRYFVDDQWRFPLLDVPAIGYPEGGSVLLNDALPIGALATKIVYSLTGHAINPFGWWIYLTYVLQGVGAAAVVYVCGVRSRWVSIAAAVLAICCNPFMRRLWHIALSSHFLVLWALALYVYNVRRGRFTAGWHFALSAMTILVNSYLFVMIGLLQGTTFVTLWNARMLRPVDWAKATLGLVAVVAIAIAEGYGALLIGNGSMRAFGFGHYSWNLATLLVPPEAYWGFPRGVVRDATGGQHEGEAYLGLGSMLVLVVCLLARPNQVVAAARRHWIFCVALLAFAAYAASNRVYLGSWLLADLRPPDRIAGLTSFFRASGRFIWIPMYALGLLSLAALVKWTPRMIALPVVVLAVLVQVREATLTAASLRSVLARPARPLVDTPQVRRWMQQHQRLFQFPSWSCGGLDPARDWTRPETNREVQLELLAARVGLPTNSVYTSRQMKDCAAEAHWADRPILEDGVLYVLNKTTARDVPGLAGLATSRNCIDADWGLLCSLRPLTPASQATPMRSGADYEDRQCPANSHVTQSTE